VGGHGILRNVELAGDLARGEAGGRVADEQAETSRRVVCASAASAAMAEPDSIYPA